ncbi:MAG: flippase [Atribacterota bacterium]|nr:flippase [Atribacterota bacterium]
MFKVKNLSVEKQRLIENFLSLSMLQGANYLLPLITLPYLVRVLGPEKYGLVAFAQAFIYYFIILTDYGFNLSATREISINRNKHEKVSEIFSSVMIIKLALMLVSFILMYTVVYTIGKFRKDFLVYVLTFGMVVGNVIFPVWFFQGIEKMKYITFLNILARLIFTVCIFIFIKKSTDYIYVPLINSMGYLVAGVSSLFLISKNFKVKFRLPNSVSIRHELREGWHIFISTIAISMYTTSNTFILGLFTNNTIVAYYSAAEKIVKAIQGLWSPVSRTLYPYFSRLCSENKKKAIIYLKKALIFTTILTFFISLGGYFFSTIIIKMLLGEKYIPSIIIFKILIFIVFAVGVNNILGIQGLVAFGYAKEFSKIVSLLGLLHLILIFILIPLFGYLIPAIITVITESNIILFEYVFLRRKKII